MKKLKNVKFDEEKYDLNKLLSTKYDSLFRDVIRSRGRSYYINNKIEKFHKKKNKITSIVKGTKDYNVSIEYLPNDEIKVNCECEYHKNTDIYCKHVYSLLLTLKLIHETKKMLTVYHKNVKRINEINALIRAVMYDNEQYIDPLSYIFHLNTIHYFEDNLESISQFIDVNNVFKVRSSIRYTYEYLDDIINKYNKIVDEIENGKIKYEERKKESEKEVTITYTTTIDEEIDEYLDNLMGRMPLSVLNKVRKENIKNGESTEIIDKAIAQRKKRNQIIEEEYQKKYEEEAKKRKNKSFFGLLSELFESFSGSTKKKSSSENDNLMPWEKDLVNQEEYESYNFEEEELEEDDFYYEDE